MIIANPIYDTVFKRMMENERVAKFFIGTLLNQHIEAIEVKPQEFTHTDKPSGISVFRLDFIATIKTEDGEYRKILIEIQKAKNEIDLMRFRRYLAEQYKKTDMVENQAMVLPITTIYVLGFNLLGISSACIKVGRYYQDLVEGRITEERSDFLEKLSHDCFVVQVCRITGRYQTRLDQLLSVFQQNNFVDDNKITKKFQHPTDNDDVRILTDILHYAGTDPEEREQIENEQEAWRTINEIMESSEKKLRKEIDEKDKVIDEKDKVIDEKDKVIDEKDKALHEMERQLEELRRRLNSGA